MLTSGALDDKIMVLIPVSSTGNYNDPSTEYISVGTRWADVQYQKGNRALEFGDEFIMHSITITCRYTAVITEHCRIGWDGKTYAIDSLNRDKRNGSMTIICGLIEEGSNGAAEDSDVEQQ